MIYFSILKEKVSLLAKQITTLKHGKSVLQTENAKLRKRVKNLEQQLDRVNSKGELADDTVEVLKLLFEHDGLTVSQVAATLICLMGWRSIIVALYARQR